MKSVWVLFLVCVANIAFGAEGILTELGGQGRFRFESNDQTDYSSQRSAFLVRIRPEVKLSKGSDVSLFLQPQFSKAFGRPEFVGTSTTANASQTTSGATYDNALSVHQAWMSLSPGEGFRFVIGRQALSYGSQLALSGLDWDNIGRSFDAIKGVYSHERGSVDLFYSKLFAANVTSVPQAAGDGDLAGLYSANNFGKGFSNTDLYLLYRKDQTTGPTNELFAVGTRLESAVDSFDYRVEATKELGSQFAEAAEAYQADVEVGFQFETPVKSRVGVEYFRAGATYDQLYPLGHKYLGIADVFGRRNIQGGALHVKTTPAASVTLQADLHYFMRTSSSHPAYKLNGTTALGTGAGSSALGFETDLVLTYAITKEVSAVLGGAVLFPTGYLTETFGDKKPAFWYTQVTVQL